MSKDWYGKLLFNFAQAELCPRAESPAGVNVGGRPFLQQSTGIQAIARLTTRGELLAAWLVVVEQLRQIRYPANHSTQVGPEGRPHSAKPDAMLLA